ncbi:MAG: serine/threonine protein kinase [Chthoniobacteraceae bacterium]|nr:serine/threonine protein kinase [Chthoniobacteraceae bacterium]
MTDSIDPPKPNACPVCGAALSDAAGGLCPRCLMEDAAQTTHFPGFASLGEPPSLETVKASFPQFEIIEFIGKGGMGTVWKARQPNLHRHVALKLLPASLAGRDPAFAERFAREGQLLARLHHPNIVAVYDSGRAGDFFYLAMEFVDGVNLREAMHACRFTPRQALAIVPRICDAIQYAHDEGVLHRDIKPENILLDARGRVKLVDFGIAKLITQPETAPAGIAAPMATAAGDSLTLGDSTLGTPNYMAPEQIDNPSDVDNRADIYSLGVVFYELLTGELPLGKFAPPSEKSDADPRLDSIVQQALEKERGRRQKSIGEVRAQVETVAGNSEVGSATLLSGQRFSRTAIAGACWAPAFFIMFLLMFTVQTTESTDPAWWQYALRFTLLPLGLTAPFGTTILGWVAVSQIRRSQGRLSGLGFALFDGLIFPLLVLDSLIFLFAARGIGPVLERLLTESGWRLSDLRLPIYGMLIVGVCGLVDYLIVRRVWQSMNPAPLVSSAPTQRGGNLGSMGPTILLHAGLLILLCAVFLFIVPRFVAIYKNFQVRLPIITQLVLGLGNAWLLLLFVLILDVACCYLILRRGGQNALRRWSIFVIAGLVVSMGITGIALALPLIRITTELGHPAGFGPVIERVIALDDQSTAFYSVDKAGYVPMPQNFEPLPDNTDQTDTARIVRARLWKWLTANNVDFLAQRNQGTPVLVLSDMLAFDCSEADFDRLQARDLQAAQTFHELAQKGMRPNFRSPLTGRQGEKITLAFQTRFERFGVVQVLGVSNDPPGVKIRYKLVENASQATTVVRSRFPKAASLVGSQHSVMVKHDDVDVHYLFYLAGGFSTSISDSSNKDSLSWTDKGEILLDKNGPAFGYHRESNDPTHLRINDRKYDLIQGRVFVLSEDGTLEQRALEVSLGLARNPAALGTLIREQAETSN